jgi:hypothetical protein
VSTTTCSEQPLFQAPTSVDYYTGDTPPLEFPLDDLLGGNADDIGGTQLTRAPPVTQLTQEQQHTMMEDFHDSTRCAGEVLDAAASVEAEARATGRGWPHQAQRLHRHRLDGGHPVGLGDSTGSDRRGVVSSGSGAPLATPPPSRRSKDAIAIHATPSRTRPTTRGLHRGQWQRRGGRSTRARDDRRNAVVFRFVFGHLSCTLLCLF